MVADAAVTGLWQIPKSERTILQGGVIIICTTPVFALDGEYVTLLLVQPKAWGYRSPDDFYKLKVKWEGPKLYYLPPFGAWTHLADYDGKQFVATHESHVWKYTRISENELEPQERAIVEGGRAPHDYTTKRIGTK